MKKIKLPERIINTDLQSQNSISQWSEGIYTFLNPVSYLDALNNKELFDDFDGIFADGSILVAAIRMAYGKKVVRRSFDMTSLAPQLFNYASSSRKSIYIVASKQSQIERAVEIFLEKYPDLIIKGYRNGYFQTDDERLQEYNYIIKEIKPDIVIVGMGTIVQERFLLGLKKSGFSGKGFTCGGFIHKTASNKIDYYPRWVDKLNLRFLYRMLKESYTRQRYAKAAFLFPVRFLAEKFE
jgi:N-acetylglucosaminyldiphosphoundecaprenol N-acetyl-beta-D-mannosaminyltransferase